MVQPGVRYASTPFSDSRVVSETVKIDSTTWHYRKKNGEFLDRSEDSIGLHTGAGYRWIWASRLYVLLATGLPIPVYDRFEMTGTCSTRTKIFWGPWHVEGMRAVGMVF